MVRQRWFQLSIKRISTLRKRTLIDLKIILIEGEFAYEPMNAALGMEILKTTGNLA